MKYTKRYKNAEHGKGAKRAPPSSEQLFESLNTNAEGQTKYALSSDLQTALPFRWVGGKRWRYIMHPALFRYVFLSVCINRYINRYSGKAGSLSSPADPYMSKCNAERM